MKRIVYQIGEKEYVRKSHYKAIDDHMNALPRIAFERYPDVLNIADFDDFNVRIKKSIRKTLGIKISYTKFDGRGRYGREIPWFSWGEVVQQLAEYKRAAAV